VTLAKMQETKATVSSDFGVAKRDQICRERRGKEGGPHEEAGEHIYGGGGARRWPELAEVCGSRRCKSRA
jgi:hypothetical protein